MLVLSRVTRTTPSVNQTTLVSIIELFGLLLDLVGCQKEISYSLHIHIWDK